MMDLSSFVPARASESSTAALPATAYPALHRRADDVARALALTDAPLAATPSQLGLACILAAAEAGAERSWVEQLVEARAGDAKTTVEALSERGAQTLAALLERSLVRWDTSGAARVAAALRRPVEAQRAAVAAAAASALGPEREALKRRDGKR